MSYELKISRKSRLLKIVHLACLLDIESGDRSFIHMHGEEEIVEYLAF